MPLHDGELPGVRRTIDEMVKQERASRPSVPAHQIEREIQNIALDYDRKVRSGEEPPPVRRDGQGR
jgi:hypothetical protein